MTFNPYYVTGLVDGEGCFSVSFSLREKLRLKIETRPSFSISLNQRDLSLIKRLHEFFKCGNIRYSKSDQTYKFEVRSIHDLIHQIIPHFDQYPLHGSKSNDFKLFKEICNNVYTSCHKNQESLVTIIETAYQMNPSGKRKFDKSLLLTTLGKKMV
jgi:hypothetical protein